MLQNQEIPLLILVQTQIVIQKAQTLIKPIQTLIQQIQIQIQIQIQTLTQPAQTLINKIRIQINQKQTLIKKINLLIHLQIQLINHQKPLLALFLLNSLKKLAMRFTAKSQIKKTPIIFCLTSVSNQSILYHATLCFKSNLMPVRKQTLSILHQRVENYVQPQIVMNTSILLNAKIMALKEFMETILLIKVSKLISMLIGPSLVRRLNFLEKKNG
jgi:hypothetical protein